MITVQNLYFLSHPGPIQPTIALSLGFRKFRNPMAWLIGFEPVFLNAVQDSGHGF
jgi:hypothetical protein